MGRGRPGDGRRIGSVVVAAVFALALAVTPRAAGTALAASDPLRTEASATYTLDPEAGRVHVEIDVTVTDLKPNTPSYIYYYTSFGFALQSEATSIRVSGGSASRVTTRKRESFIEATVHVSPALFYKDSTSFTIRYELVGGKPRSESPTRVGAAFSTFAVWAWGDAGRSTVEVRTPVGVDTSFTGDPMQVASSTTTGQILRATPADPSTFFAIITAENDSAYREARVSLEGGVEIVVQAWPEDDEWLGTTSGTLREAMPALRGLIGLDWPVEHDLDVRERYTPALEGFAGLFITDEQRIEVSEDLDPVVIVHEASHAWFNDSLFLERWIYEGLAEEYAWRALRDAGIENGEDAERPDPEDPGFIDLGAWTKPQVIRDQGTDDRERFGYQAAFWVIHQIAETAGVELMRDAFARADADLTAYPGAEAPEKVLAGDSWRRLLDLTQPLDEPDPAAVDEAVRAFVLGSGDERALDDRRAAREAYRALLGQGDGWLPGWYVRAPMGEWDFRTATTRMAEAAALLVLRDRVTQAASELGLHPDEALRTAYEGATDGLVAVMSIAQAQLDTLTAVAAARTKVEQTPDLVAQVGLLGEAPMAPYDGARAAFEAGDPAAALALANAASSIIDGAPAAGQQRLLVAAAATAAALLLLTLLVVLPRRRRRVAAFGPYATLAADPDLEHDEGGHAHGETPAEP